MTEEPTFTFTLTLTKGRRQFLHFPTKSQPRTGHTREPDPTHNELKHTITRKTGKQQHSRTQPRHTSRSQVHTHTHTPPATLPQPPPRASAPYSRRVEYCTGKKTPGGAGKKTPGGAGTHTGHTGTRITQTNLTTIQTHQPTAVRSRPTHRGAWPAQKDTGGSRDTTVTPTPHTTTVKRSDCPSAKQRAVGKARCLLVIKGEWSATWVRRLWTKRRLLVLFFISYVRRAHRQPEDPLQENPFLPVWKLNHEWSTTSYCTVSLF